MIEGFTLGIATIIFLQQLPATLGQTSPQGRPLVQAALQVLIAADWAAA